MTPEVKAQLQAEDLRFRNALKEEANNLTEKRLTELQNEHKRRLTEITDAAIAEYYSS